MVTAFGVPDSIIDDLPAADGKAFVGVQIRTSIRGRMQRLSELAIAGAVLDVGGFDFRVGPLRAVNDPVLDRFYPVIASRRPRINQPH